MSVYKFLHPIKFLYIVRCVSSIAIPKFLSAGLIVISDLDIFSFCIIFCSVLVTFCLLFSMVESCSLTSLLVCSM